MLSFYKTLFRDPKSVGSVIPSSRFLSKKIAKQVPLSQEGKVIEIGPGTGVISRALLKHGVPAADLILVERSQDFITSLHKKFPQVTLIQADALQINRVLNIENETINSIISGLPLLSMPDNIAIDILDQITSLMDKDTLFIQFSYTKNHRILQDYQGLKLIKQHRVLLNIPPAWVMCFRLK